MVSFTCDKCNETLKKQKVSQHISFGPCRGASVTCIDCMKTFQGRTFEGHTSCLSEAQRYQGKLYRGEKPTKSQQQFKSPAVPQKSTSSSISATETSQSSLAVSSTSSPSLSPSPVPSTTPSPSSSSNINQSSISLSHQKCEKGSWKPLLSSIPFDWKMEASTILSSKSPMKSKEFEEEIKNSFYKTMRGYTEELVTKICHKKV
eukprot:MONOS_14922.1-p1 / transcript=MONOS_14922.1 / gene=MONOS_14922 / organism=Monocercomonoides_exilis_PA203 / gene_product=unspecified product / transcript_product=unspecified product / location=Mono_scaffold01105:13306-13994(-) / protein_length=203 / sequence_SO=supercontig / SO=protein_coding / is_pseudo=false